MRRDAMQHNALLWAHTAHQIIREAFAAGFDILNFGTDKGRLEW